MLLDGKSSFFRQTRAMGQLWMGNLLLYVALIYVDVQ